MGQKREKRICCDDIQEGNVAVKVDGFVGVDDCEVFCEPHFEFRVY